MKNFIILLLFVTTSVFSQTEFLVNTFQDSVQRAPVIAQKGDGTYAIVWQSINQASGNSNFDIYIQNFDNTDNKVGGETLINHPMTDAEQSRPSLAMNQKGDYVIAWTSNTGQAESIFDVHSFYNINGSEGFHMTVNSVIANSQTKPSVDIADDGSFIVVWESWHQDGSNNGIYGQKFLDTGVKDGSEFLINTTTQFSQARPNVEYLVNGNFVVVWESWKQDVATPSGYGLFGKIFDSSGNVIVDEFQVNTYTNDYQWFGDIAKLSDGGFVIVWCSWEQDGDDGGIYLQKFDDSGSKIGTEQLVNKTTVYYQWLPKVKEMPDGKIGVAWSSWRQDGSREGVYAKLLKADLTPATFETRVNDYTDSYQWEPDFIPTGIDEMVVTWASWGEYDNDYEVMAKRITLTGPQAALAVSSYGHAQGVSTSRFFVHVMDSTKLTGDQYELSFEVIDEDNASARVYNITKSTEVIAAFPINGGEGVFYLTQEFDGVTLEIQPNFTFAIDQERSYFRNNTGSNLTFNYGPGAGSTELAPIDIKLVWGSTETNAEGNYVNSLDSAYNTSEQKVVMCPFYAWNITDNEPMDLVIIEPAQTANLNWDVTEVIGVLTPPQYATAFPRYHVGINAISPGDAVLPGEGDINYIFTIRPLTSDDVFTFETNKGYITTGVKNSSFHPVEFGLGQNYPNPFNPSTTITYAIPSEGSVKLTVYNLLGETVAVLVNKEQKAGSYKILFNGFNYASGVYFYNIRHQNKSITKKMLLMK